MCDIFCVKTPHNYNNYYELLVLKKTVTMMQLNGSANELHYITKCLEFPMELHAPSATAVVTIIYNT